MRLCFFLGLFLLMGRALDAQTLFTYGKHRVSQNEFLRAFHKNNITGTATPDEIDQYLDLFVRFKLKVQAAREMKLDTLPQINNDLRNFRQQIADNYLVDEPHLNRLVNEAAQRSATELHIIHFAVPANDVNGEKAAQSIFADLNRGDKNFERITQSASSFSPSRYVDAGYLTAFSVPYNFENIIYNLPVDGVSEPYQTPSAWHVFFLQGKRPNSGTWKVAQILFALPENAPDYMVQAARAKADSVHGLLKDGMPFAEAARLFSDDKLSYALGGELPPFTTGKYDPVFEKQVYALKKDHEISAPFKTDYGFHIVRRLEHFPFPGSADEAFLYDLRQKVLNDPRMEEGRKKFLEDVVRHTGLMVTKEVPQSELLRLADTVMADLSAERFDEFPISKKTVLRFKNGSQTGADWLRFVRDYKANYELDKGEKGEALWKKYLETASLKNYRDNLEKFNESFAFQMKEFEEGNLLFEVMERRVWGKASSDSAGLENHFSKNRDNYKWEESFTVVAVHAPDTAVGNGAYRLFADKNNLTAVLAAYPTLYTDTSRYEAQTLRDLLVDDQLQTGKASSLKVHSDNSTVFYIFQKHHAAGELKTFEEARGAVINDYQQLLEEEWIRELRKKYPVKINNKTLAAVKLN